jgi:LEA14-like dessication related protein
MNRLRTLAPLTAGLLAACATPPPPAPPAPPQVTVDSKKTEVTKQGLTEFTLKEDLTVQSTDASPVTVAGAHWELVFDGNVVALGDHKFNVQVPPNGSVDLEVDGSGIYAKDVQAVEAMSAHRGGFPVALRGNLDVVGANGASAKVEFAKSNFLREPRVPKVLVQDISGSHYDDGHINVRLSFAIDNPNPFSVSVAALTYKIAVNGYVLGEQTQGKGVEVAGGTRKVFEETEELTPEKMKELPELYKKNAMTYSMTGVLDLGLAKADFALDGPIFFNK